MVHLVYIHFLPSLSFTSLILYFKNLFYSFFLLTSEMCQVEPVGFFGSFEENKNIC